MTTTARATIDDLYRVPEHGKAEIVDGELVLMSPTGALPGRAGGAIYASLRQFEKATRSGFAFPDNVGFVVDLPNRKSFSPDVAFFAGAKPNMRFVEGAPIFAVEIRSENDYGPAAEKRMARKRADYFAAGTAVVWDVDLAGPEVIRAYREGAAEPRIFLRGQIADAEPALPGWTFPVDELFE
jgi:Uma2 family endonuclease